MEESILSIANTKFNNGQYAEAIELYQLAITKYPLLSDSLQIVIDFTSEKYKKATTPVAKTASVDRFSGKKARVEINPNDPRLKLEKPNSLEDFYFDQIKESGLFDPSFYLSEYFEELSNVTNLLDDYLSRGIENKRNPSKAFNLKYYLKNNPDVASSDVNPFLHYVCNGRQEGREAVPKPYMSSYEVSEAKYVKRLPKTEECNNTSARVVCFYLPQFHAIPENDEWWGKGFTEWSNVKPAKPQFEGHYQPHVPDEFLGYYNLLEKETQRKQIELAKQYGVEGFCYYLYWFSGQRLLEQPLDNMLEDPSLDFPFCVCWANENWSRRWDGLENDLLMVQDYSPEDDLAFIESTSKYLKDERYIRINGRPLLMVYRPNLFPDMKATSKRWRDWCRENGVGEIYLAYPQSFESVSPHEYDFDGAVEFPPNKSNPPNITEFQKPLVDEYETTVFDWRVFLERSEQYKDVDYKLFRSVTPSWDNTARKKNKGTVFHNSCPKLFEQTLVNAINETLRSADSKDEELVFVNAWNEWAEGAHLEPDQKYGYAWLQAIKNAHDRVLEKKNKIILVSHDAHPHGAQVLCLNMARELSEHFNFSVETIILGDGALLPKFKQYGNVHQIHLHIDSEDKISEILQRLKAKGFDQAIVNTAVSGSLSPYLHNNDIQHISLIHELPKVLAQYNLQEQVASIIKYSEKVIFPAEQVREGFEEFANQTLENSALRPQGLFQPSILRKGVTKADCKKQLINQYSLPNESKIIVNVAFADHRKGFDLFVDASCDLFSRHNNLYAIWVGHHDGAFVDKSLEKARKLGFEDRILLTNGYVDDPQVYYAGSDIFALTSREDPFPSVVLESLDAETPLVAFKDCGGFQNLIERGCGLLAEKENVSSYVSQLDKLLSNPDQCRSLAKTGREIIDREFRFHHYIFDLIESLGFKLPKVSVVVPNYNYANYIESRLDSVFNQTYPIYELLILDDRSTDNSVEVIKEYLKEQSFPAQLIVNEVNSGSVFKQWHKGVELATGDLVWIAEADDVAEPTFLSTLVAMFINNEDLCLAFSQSKQIDQDGNFLSNDYLEYTSDVGDYWTEDYVVSGKIEIERSLCIKNTIPNVSAVVVDRARFLETLSDLQQELLTYRVAGDWLVYIRMLLKGSIGFSAKSLNLHRRHISSVTKVNNHMSEIIKVQNECANFTTISETMRSKITEYNKALEQHFSIVVE